LQIPVGASDHQLSLSATHGDLSLRRIDLQDSRVRKRASQDLAVKHARPSYVIDELRFARHDFQGVFARVCRGAT
jgi:hypothetical protein